MASKAQKSSNQEIILYYRKLIKRLRVNMLRSCNEGSRDDIHQLRVTIRRIRSLLALYQRHYSKLTKLAKHIGDTRDLDVTIKNGKRYKLKMNPLKKSRAASIQKIRHELTPKEQKKITQHLKKIETKLAITSLKEQLTTLEKMQHKLRGMTFNNKKELHQLRINLKKVRYIFEAHGIATTRLKAIQDQLGEIHDLEVLEKHFPDHPMITQDWTTKLLEILPILQPTIDESQKGLKKLQFDIKKQLLSFL